MLVKSFKLDVDDLEMTIDIHHDRYTPSSVWEDRQNWLDHIESSKKIWSKMTEEEQDGTTFIVKHALQRLHDRIDQILPEALDRSSGAYLDINFKVLFTDAEKAIIKHSALTHLRLEEAKSDALDLLDRLSQ